MTLTDRKGNIRGREFPTDTGIDGNACEETAKDQRWVGLYRQIPDTDTRPISLSLSPLPLAARLSLSLACSFSLTLSLSLSFSRSCSASARLTSRHPTSVHSSVRPARPYTRIAALTATNRRTTSRGTTSFHDGDPLGCRSSWKRPRRRRTPRHDFPRSRTVVL